MRFSWGFLRAYFPGLFFIMRVAERIDKNGFSFFCCHVPDNPSVSFMRDLLADFAGIEKTFEGRESVFMYADKTHRINRAIQKRGFVFIREINGFNVYQKKLCAVAAIL